MEWDGLFYATHRDVYEPSDDTFLLARVVRDEVRPGERFLEVGCGTGLVSLAAARAGARATCADVNPLAVETARHNARENRLRVEAVEADLLAGLPGPFDAVAFNPPYLPTAEDEHVEGPLDLAFDGGPDGNRVVLRFADQVAALSPLPRVVWVVHSSLSNPAPLESRMRALGYAVEEAADQRFPFERLRVVRFVRPEP